ncbi:D-alanine transaminase [Albimonas donghaensis]|uniref:Probable branched-chain-amino-acid aminotransferase n=1 Tax=Albimonas donghaensis TaxID=356660 RepID=A0A1H2TF52_9RHOB|nr:D-amino-acid transaminase [Albimonas donghaensis]SDW41904.1 D-alanine transaminase [Albimonas donghaensis]
MSRIVYVNGEYLPEEEAKISIFDRGFLMADAVYEVASVLDGKLLDYAGHEARLARSLGELEIPMPASPEEILEIHRQLVTRNGVEEGAVYMQVTRGAADRDFAWTADMTPSLVLFTQAKAIVASPMAQRGSKVISLDDLRWHRRDIKTTQLLYASMAKMQAKAAGADDAWLVEDGKITEGTSNNAWIVTKDGVLVTRQLSNDLLAGITRASLMRYAAEAQISVEERAFTVEEAKGAAEAFVTSASAFVMPVVEIDGVKLGAGSPGPVATRLREIYVEESRRTAI